MKVVLRLGIGLMSNPKLLHMHVKFNKYAITITTFVTSIPPVVVLYPVQEIQQTGRDLQIYKHQTDMNTVGILTISKMDLSGMLHGGGIKKITW